MNKLLTVKILHSHDVTTRDRWSRQGQDAGPDSPGLTLEMEWKTLYAQVQCSRSPENTFLMPKNLLVVGGGIEAIPGLERAKQMGLHLVVSDRDPEAPGFAVADDRLLASTYDIQATVAAALPSHSQVPRLHGVMLIASHTPSTLAALAADLGLPGISEE